MGVRSSGIARNVPNGVLGLDAAGRALPANMPLSRAAVLQAAQPALSNAGGSLGNFLGWVDSPDTNPGNWAAAQAHFAAPPGGTLSVLLAAYLVSRGLTAAQAASNVATIYLNAGSITP